MVANLDGKGLVVITGCSHAGVINTISFARAITGIDRVHAVLGGFHLSGILYEYIIPHTVEALRAIGPQIIAPLHCTGMRATHALAEAFPTEFVPTGVGTKYVFASG